jgi:putative zinc finger/helix-turn-helix YgiT family protein
MKMKSPISGKEMILSIENKSLTYRKEVFVIRFHSFVCQDTKEQFTNEALDEINTSQVYHQYRDTHHLPFPEEIQNVREKYGVPANKMSAILGFGVNSYRQYEAGEMPSISNAKLIQMAQDPVKFISLLDFSEGIASITKEKYRKKAAEVLEIQNNPIINDGIKSYWMGSELPDVFSGYKKLNFSKLTEMVVFFAQEASPFKTKMNKLLFYADFLMFKKFCFSISGLRYRAIEMGPVPNNFQSIFEFMMNNHDVDIEFTQFPQGYTGEQFKAKKDRPFNKDMFTESELVTLNEVAKNFKDSSTTDMVRLSHLEKAWKDNQTDKSLISYVYAFHLEQI